MVTDQCTNQCSAAELQQQLRSCQSAEGNFEICDAAIPIIT
jgi:hypothetical protein